jgi:hypothetical protein
MALVTQVVLCELIFQAISNCVSFLGRMKFKAWKTTKAVDVVGLSLLRRDFAMGQVAWCVTSELPIFVSHRLSVFLRVIHLVDFVTQLTAVLHAGSLVSCHNFLSLRLCLTRTIFFVLYITPRQGSNRKTQCFYCCFYSLPWKHVYWIVPHQMLYMSHLVLSQILYCWVRALPSKGFFPGSTVLFLSKHATILS